MRVRTTFFALAIAALIALPTTSAAIPFCPFDNADICQADGTVQTDGGGAGDAGDSPAAARWMEGERFFEGRLLPALDPADYYRFQVEGDAKGYGCFSFTAWPERMGDIRLHVISPSGVSTVVDSQALGGPETFPTQCELSGEWVVGIDSPWLGSTATALVIDLGGGYDGKPRCHPRC